ncbi:hypothetical protein Ciccas_005604 [Cichlidogyrus casuarinus]|uniref:Uncharacterized protein n=1 Tax=Cichlidogyrus casuarinus TaxID=1844966 RepID=A0ABD2QAJ2_9PLAT
MDDAVQTEKVEHIIIDNLQFMLGSSASTSVKNGFEEKFQRQDSLYGGAKLTQEADNVLLIQEEVDSAFPKRYIQVAKNRYDGQLGRVDLRFNRERKSFRPKDGNLSNPVQLGNSTKFVTFE